MYLGELLVILGLVTLEDVNAALRRQQQEGGYLGAHLVALGALTSDKLASVLPGLTRWQSLHGPRHPNTHRASYSYARALFAAGHPEEALKYAEAALEGYRATVGDTHRWTTEAVRLIGELHRAIDGPEDAPPPMRLVAGGGEAEQHLHLVGDPDWESAAAAEGDPPRHPGLFIREEILDKLGLTVNAAADVLDVRRTTLTAFLAGRTTLSAELAVRIEKAFGVDMERLLIMQARHDANAMRQRAADIAVNPYRPDTGRRTAAR